jgi:hypothetical protein
MFMFKIKIFTFQSYLNLRGLISFRQRLPDTPNWDSPVTKSPSLLSRLPSPSRRRPKSAINPPEGSPKGSKISISSSAMKHLKRRATPSRLCKFICKKTRLQNHILQYPVRHGLVEDWDLMERFMEQCIFKYLRAEPEDHYFLLTEPPLNTPENREYIAGSLSFVCGRIPLILSDKKLEHFPFCRNHVRIVQRSRFIYCGSSRARFGRFMDISGFQRSHFYGNSCR